jgi:flagellar brake protein
MNSDDARSLGKPEPRPGIEQVSDPGRVLGLLQTLWERRALLSARFDGGQVWFNTTLLDVVADERMILLDELAPIEGHRQLQPGHRLHVLGVLKGVPTHFTCLIIATGVRNGIAFYRATFPLRMDYRQRRAFFRAYVPRSMELAVRLSAGDAGVVTGRLLDVSQAGFGILLPEDSPVSALDTVTLEALELPEGQVIACNAEIRYTRREPGHRSVRAGGRFTDLAAQAARVLPRAIRQLEREQIRKQPSA